nr:MAG TPA: hypothetical protein [Bacteriophage sp.]DAH28355.1 MAG TPA: hypothetical protein [Caudoviricetes sp.]
MAGDYISREAALADFESCNAGNPNWTPQRVKTLLLRQPAADVAPVVRCKDCIYNIDGMCFSRTSFKNAVAVEPDNFCSWGATE